MDGRLKKKLKKNSISCCLNLKKSISLILTRDFQKFELNFTIVISRLIVLVTQINETK
jgi:hypothetical protein